MKLPFYPGPLHCLCGQPKQGANTITEIGVRFLCRFILSSYLDTLVVICLINYLNCKLTSPKSISYARKKKSRQSMMEVENVCLFWEEKKDVCILKGM